MGSHPPTATTAWRAPTMVLAIVSAVLLGGGCGQEHRPKGLSVYTASSPLEGPCPTTTASSSEFASEISELRAEVKGPGMEPVRGSAALGEELMIASVPGGEDRTVSLYGVAQSGAEPWRGVTKGVTVVDGERVDVDVLLTRVADLSCPRSPQSDARAFHTATKLKDGRILLVGGASEERDSSATCAGCVSLSATTSVDVYDPETGAFTPVGGLSIRRMLHTATLLDDGRVVIFGGTEEARIDPGLNFPLVPTLFVGLIEIFDPADDSIRAGGDQVAFGRVFHAATALPGGTLLVTGGIDTVNATNDLSNALDTSIYCSGTSVACGPGPTMARKRAGHQSTFIVRPDGVEEVTLWGGAVGAAIDDGAPVFQLESLRDLQSGWVIKSVSAMGANKNLFFAGATRYSPFRIVSAGGLQRFSDGTFRLADSQDGPGGPVYVYDAIAENGRGGIAVRFPNALAMSTQVSHFFSSVAELPGNSEVGSQTRAVIAGGFTDLSFTPTDTLDFFNELDLTVAPLRVGGTARTLRQSRGALVAVGVGNGTVLMSGGSTGTTALRVPLATSEIYTDSLDPTQ